MKVKNDETKLCQILDIDKTRYAVSETKNDGIIVLEELDINLDSTDVIKNANLQDLFMRKLIAYKLENEKVMNRQTRTILGEIDIEVSTKDNLKFVKLDGYAAKDRDIMNELFLFMENRAIEHGANYIGLIDACGRSKIDFLDTLGYTKTPYKKTSNLNFWDKTNLEHRTFNKTIQDAYNALKESERK